MLKLSEITTLGALTSQNAVATTFDSTVDDSTYLLSIEATYSISAHTAGEGPIVCGVAHNDYSAAEIVEWYIANGAWDRADKVAQEHNRRKIRQVGIFPGVSAIETLNDGIPVKTKLGFIVEDGQTLSLWALNEDAATLTTGTVLEAQGKVWAGL